MKQHPLADQSLEPEQYRIVVDFKAPIEACFKAGTAEEAMMVWVPNIKSVEYDHTKAAVPYGAGSFRHVRMNGGVAVVERVLVSQPPTLLIYSIEANAFVNNHVLRNYRGFMHFAPLASNETRLTWVGHFASTPLLRPLARTVIRGMIRTFATRMSGYLTRQ
ncbi:MAG: SRPBCC family protein [Steroidobacteraceae bacterium]